jgi:hypothetical protein
MKKKRHFYPRSVLKNLAEEIKKLATSNEGRMFILEMVEDVPFEVRPYVLEGLSAFYEPEMVTFFHLLKVEYGKELEATCDRALDKYRLAGMNIAPPSFFPGSFYKAFATCTRQSGRITLDVAWNTGQDGVQVECFYLSFNTDGLHSFFLVEDMPRQQYYQDRALLTDMVELSFAEVCHLVSHAYRFNVRNMSKPALGKFFYRKYLHSDLDSDSQSRLVKKLTPRLTPRQLVNSFFHGFKYHDLSYVLSILHAGDKDSGRLFADLNQVCQPGALLLEGQVVEVFGSRQTARVTAYSITMEENEFYRSEYSFILITKDNTWQIGEIDRKKREAIPSQSEFYPLNTRVYCRVYEIADMDMLFDVLDRVDNIREVEELPYGMHMRITCYEDDLNHGVTFLTGVIADLVINGEEFVVMARDRNTSNDLHDLLTCDYTVPVQARGEYEVSLMTAFGYLGGQYVSFEDLLLPENPDALMDDGMRLLSARYVVKERKPVLQRVKELGQTEIDLGDIEVFYQLEKDEQGPVFFVEYMLGPNWISLTTFGDRDMNYARKIFENELYDYLEFDGLELRQEGIFSILTPQLKKDYPELESFLKEVHLDKWYYLRMTPLSGMSPSEACQTEEGRRLLWTMFKRFKQRERKHSSTRHNGLQLREYMRKVDLKKETKS